MPQNQTAEHVPQPVKKRSRFSNIAAAIREENLPTHQRNVPTGFVRDLLDEEDSEDDPDFDGDIELSDEDDDALDDVLEADIVLENPNCDENRQLSSPSDRHTQINTALPIRDNISGDDPEFEVDSLDSTDDEDENEALQKGLPQSAQNDASNLVNEGTQYVNFGDIELNSDDEEDDPDFEATIDEGDLRCSAEICDNDDEPGQSEARDDEYIQFLMSLLEDNGEEPMERVQTAETNEERSKISDPSPDRTAILTGDDDDDFDYLRASAMIQDDPLEYRDDLHVSRKEVAQLLFNNNESTLRRQTRTLRAKKAPAQSSWRFRESEDIVPPVPLPVVSGLPGPSIPAQLHSGGFVPRPGPGQLPTKEQTRAAPQALVGPHQTSFASLSPAQMFKFNEQFGVYIQILTHVHAVCKKKLRASREQEFSGAEPEERNAQSDPKVASEKSEVLLRRILQNHMVSTSYHALIKAHITKMKAFSEGLLHRKGQAVFSYETSKSPAYDKPVIGLIVPFLRECETADLGSLPDSALKPFEPFERQDVRQALSARPNQRQHTMSRAREGWFAWTAADDNLLAMTIAKYGRECGDYVRDLLPHRLEEDCQARVRYLASRRCQDNPVKRQVLHISIPLNRDELKLVEIGLQQFDGKIDDPNVWKQIQRDLLPTREWSHLQKLWLWRETRRRYKATYRAKLNRKKTLNQGTVVG